MAEGVTMTHVNGMAAVRLVLLGLQGIAQTQ
jgi:hypothetical protein